MYIKKVELNNFRNYPHQVVEFSNGYNLISGINGQGKTNLVESIVVASLGESPRTHHIEELIKDDSVEANVKITIEKSFGEQTIEYTLNSDKYFSINNNPIKKLSELFGNLVTVYFSPKELEIISGGPQERRDFMDADISELSGNYYSLVQRYNKVLFQRNKLLKNTYDHKAILDQIDIWNEQLASLAAPIIKTRKNFINQLKDPAQKALNHISKQTEKLEFEYIGASGETIADIKKNILAYLRENLSKDMEVGYTTIGPHRDDVKITLNGKDTKIYASQGQKRSIVLAIKIGELSLFENVTGEKPVLVLDDVFSELDTTRQKKVYDSINGYQVLLTGTVFKNKPNTEYKSLKVKNAKIK